MIKMNKADLYMSYHIQTEYFMFVFIHSMTEMLKISYEEQQVHPEVGSTETEVGSETVIGSEIGRGR